MRYLITASLLGLLLLLGGGCTKDQSDLDTAAFIDFSKDSGYTWQDDTMPLSDTLHIGVIATKGSRDLRSLFVYVTYDNGPAVRQDSVHVDSNPFNFEKTVVTRDQAGKEKWTFTVVESNGDKTNRSLTFTVQ